MLVCSSNDVTMGLPKRSQTGIAGNCATSQTIARSMSWTADHLDVIRTSTVGRLVQTLMMGLPPLTTSCSLC